MIAAGGGLGHTVAERDRGGEADVLLQDVVPVEALCHRRAVSGVERLVPQHYLGLAARSSRR